MVYSCFSYYKIDDASVLTNIAINNSNSDICQLATKKVQNNELLKEIVENSQNYGVWDIALSQIDDDNILINFAESQSKYYLRSQAINNIKNETLLINFVKKRLKYTEEDFENGNIKKSKLSEVSEEYSLCNYAIENIHDESFLKDIVKKDYSYTEEAINNIHDQEFLINIALNPDNKHRQSAIKNIIDEETLINIAKNDSNEYIREAAINQISNQDIVVEIISNDYEIEVYRLDLDYIDDDLLFDLVKKENNWIRRRHFVKSIQNTEYLKDIVFNDMEYDVCKTAIEKIHDETFLKELFDYDFGSSIFNDTVRRTALKNIHDESFLKDIFENTEYGLYTLKNIKDESFLISIAQNCHDSEFRNESLKNINDESVLTQIALTDPQMYIRIEAVKKIRNDFALINIYIMDMDFQEYNRPYCIIYLVRKEAKSRLKELIRNPEIQTTTQYVDILQKIRYELDTPEVKPIPLSEVINNSKQKLNTKKRKTKQSQALNKKNKKSDSKLKLIKLLEDYKDDALVSIAGGFNSRDLFKKGSIFDIVKEPDNLYDMEAIAVKQNNETIAYIANSINTVVRGTMSAGRIYDKFNNDAKIELIFVDNPIIAKLII